MAIAPARSTLVQLAYNQSPMLVGVMVSLLGFVIAALAIVIAVQDRGVVGELQGGRGDLWRQLMGVFASTSKTVGVAALCFFVTSSLGAPEGDSALGWVVGYIFVGLLIVVGLQVAKVIHVLEGVGSLANQVG